MVSFHLHLDRYRMTLLKKTLVQSNNIQDLLNIIEQCNQNNKYANTIEVETVATRHHSADHVYEYFLSLLKKKTNMSGMKGNRQLDTNCLSCVKIREPILVGVKLGLSVL